MLKKKKKEISKSLETQHICFAAASNWELRNSANQVHLRSCSHRHVDLLLIIRKSHWMFYGDRILQGLPNIDVSLMLQEEEGTLTVLSLDGHV